MDGRTEKQEDAAVIIVENEAESMPGQEETPAAAGHSHLDTCPVCHLNFHSREPKLLPCLHSFCKKCMPPPSRNLAMAEPPRAQVDSATRPLNVIRCPVCRQECMEVDVMENVFVKDSAEAPSSTVERTAQLCMTCDDNTEAAGFCVDCVEYLCTTCVEAHQRVKFTKDHTIRQKTEISQEVHGMSTQRPMFCDVHKQEPLKLFCETCDLLTCRDCQLVKHKDHNYQFLEDAYKNHKQHMETMTHQLQEKKKVIEEVSNSIKNGLLQVSQNRTSVYNEIKRSICSLILEINKKGKMLVGQLEAVTKDHESVLRKQQEDIGYLSRHLDHVISFTKWATARNGGTALLYCKRLILYQIGNLLQAKCSTSFIPQSTVQFQCRSSYWASNVDLGSLVVESVPGHQQGGFQGILHQPSQPGQGPSGSPHSFALGASHNTLAQLQMQVDRLNPQAHWQSRPPPPPWTWYQSVRLQRTVPRPLQGASPSRVSPQLGRRFMAPPPSHVSPTSSLPSPGFTPQPLMTIGSSSSYQSKPIDVLSSLPLCNHIDPLPVNGNITSPQSQQTMDPMYINRRNDADGHPVYLLRPNYPQSLPVSLPHRHMQGQQSSSEYVAVSMEEKPGTVSWKPPETQHANGAVDSAVRKRRRSSPGPIINIKDEPDDDSSYVQANQRASLPDSTGDQLQINVQVEENKVPLTLQSSDNNPQSQSEITPKHMHSAGQHEVNKHHAQLEDANEALCAVCRTGGELLSCDKCPKVFHLKCHVPSLLKFPSGSWFCSLCRALLAPEMEYDCDNQPDAKKVKKEPDSEGGILCVDKRRCERLLLHLFCSELSSEFCEPVAVPVCANNRMTLKGPANLSSVKKRLEARQGLSYKSPADFVADVRSTFGNCSGLSEADTEVTLASNKLKESFEEQLRIIYPDRTFPEIKLETAASDLPDCHGSSVENTPQPAENQHKYSEDPSRGV